MLIIPCEVESIRSRKDRTWSVTLGTSELSPDQVGELSRTHNKAIYAALKDDAFKEDEKALLKGIEPDMDAPGKSQSSRIRAVLFLLWKQDTKGFERFIDFYNHQTEQYINHLKKHIE